MQFDTLLFERRDAVAYVTLNRPDRLNALNLALITDLREAAPSGRGGSTASVAIEPGARASGVSVANACRTRV